MKNNQKPLILIQKGWEIDRHNFENFYTNFVNYKEGIKRLKTVCKGNL